MQTPDTLEFLNFLTKELMLHQTTLYGKNLMKTNSSLILEIHMDGELAQYMAWIQEDLGTKVRGSWNNIVIFNIKIFTYIH